MQVDFLGSFGDDLFAVNAARVSHAKWKERWDGRDESLVNFLGRMGHWSPMSHCFASFRVTATFAVARQLWKTHIGIVPTPAWNEVSRRYVDDDPTYDLPEVWRGRPQPGQSKQGSSGEIEQPELATQIAETAIASADAAYKSLLELGVAPEQARLVLPMAGETLWIWSGTLYAFIRICKERLAPEAQKETQGCCAGNSQAFDPGLSVFDGSMGIGRRKQ